MKTKNLLVKSLLLLFHIVIYNNIFSKNSFENSSELLKVSTQNIFIENKGQWHQDVLFLYKTGNMDAWITKYGINYTFYKVEMDLIYGHEKSYSHNERDKVTGHRVIMEYLNHNINPISEGKGQLAGKHNYYIGKDANKHAENVSLYQEVVVKNVYDGIDIRYYIDKGYLRYDYVVHPGADASQIEFIFKGQSNDYIKNNHIIFTTRFGNIEIKDLQSFQSTKKIASKFIKKGSNYSFELGAYDKNKTLVIDPLIYSTFLGGSGNEVGKDIAYFSTTGHIFITGKTTSTNYDLSTGPFQNNMAGIADAFVTRLNTGLFGNALVYSTYLGGDADDDAKSIAVNATGNAYITGKTFSSNFPTSTSCYQANRNGATDAFITVLTSSGNLNISTYFGGGSEESGNGIAVDNNGNFYVTGYTNSVNFPINNHYQTYQGNYDAFVSKFQSNGSSLLYSTFIGGAGNDEAYDIKVDSSYLAYIVGKTESSINYPVTTGALQTVYGGGTSDGFITKLNSTGNSLIYSTYFGGNDLDEINALDIEPINILYNIYVTGNTKSNIGFPLTTSAFQTTIGGLSDAFVSKISHNGSLSFSTYLGGAGDDYSKDIKVYNGKSYITGYAANGYPTTLGALYPSYIGFIDAFISQLNSTGNQLLYSTYIGGVSVDNGVTIDVDTLYGGIYAAGLTQSANFPISSFTYQNALDGTVDAFLIKICPMSAYLSSVSGTDTQNVCVNNAISNITYNTVGVGNVSFTGLPPGVSGTFANNEVTISGTPISTGTFNYTATLTSTCGNIIKNGTITVNTCTNVEEFTQNQFFDVFPIPNNGNFSITTSKPVNVEIIDITGKVLNKFYIIENQKSIHANLSEGVYFIKDVDNNYVKKIIVTK
jgi:hypothetical protein